MSGSSERSDNLGRAGPPFLSLASPVLMYLVKEVTMEGHLWT